MPARYYNKTPGSLSLPLRDGTSLYITRKSWSEIVPDRLDGSAALRKAEAKNLVVRDIVSPDPASE